MSPTHDQFTLLYEDEYTKVLQEFKGVVADDVVGHIIDFLKGCGYCEASIHEVMQEKATDFFEAHQPLRLPAQQDELIGLD